MTGVRRKVRSGGLQRQLAGRRVIVESGKGCHLGIRPEHIDRAETSTAIELVVGLVEQIGAQTYVLGKMMATKSARYLLATMC